MRYFIGIVLIFLSIVFTSCDGFGNRKGEAMANDTIDLPQILERDTLVALTAYSSTSYFIYRGQAMGFEYELLKQFSKHLGVELRMVVVREVDSILPLLNNYNGDLVASAMAVTQRRREVVDFTDPLTYSDQVLVQRKPEKWYTLNAEQQESLLVKSVVDLIGKTVHVKENSTFYTRLNNLSAELGDSIHVKVIDGNYTTEELIAMVARGEIDYTVAHRPAAELSKVRFNNIDVSTPVSFPQRMAWAVRKTSPLLLAELDAWLQKNKRTTGYNVLYNKYFKNQTRYRSISESEYSSFSGKSISPFDKTFKKYAAEIGFDWRLMASMVYQESHFDPWAESWMGAVGLMQIMPETASLHGEYDLWNPEQNIAAGAAHLKRLKEIYLSVADSAERVKFVLAAYNVGPGHVSDARKLAEKYGKDPNIWDGNTGEMMRLKSESQYYSDTVVEFGYCRGFETVNYVKEVLDRFEHYKQFFK